MFKRVPNKQRGRVQSRHLYVQFGGPGCGILQGHLQEKLGDECAVDEYNISRESSPDCFLSFADVQVAARAKTTLDGWLSPFNKIGRACVVRYARRGDEEPLKIIDDTSASTSTGATSVSPAVPADHPVAMIEDHTHNELVYVNEFYNRIADHFSETRHHAWPLVDEYVSGLQPGSALLDVGCGNGRHLLCAAPNVIRMGCDVTQRFVEICSDRGLSALRCDGLHLPYRSSLFDLTICIAVIHHMETEDNRIRLLQELLRVTQVEGEVLVTAWAFEQDEKSKRVFKEQDVMVPWQLPRRFDPKASEDAKVTAIQRYCHVFKKGELEALISAHLPNAVVISVSYERSNWCVTLRKVS